MKASPPKVRIDPALFLLLVTAFLTPLLGGYILNDTTLLKPGLVAAVIEAFTDSGAPVLTHLLLALPMLAGIVWVITKRKVQQVPKQLFTSIWAIFFLFLGFSTIYSSYRTLSFTLWLEWLCYGCALFAAVSIGGRRLGPLLVATAIACGSSIVAIKGIMEYGAMRSTDASWRVFGGWVNPNATAAVLCLGLFVGLGLCLSQSRGSSLIAGIGSILCIFALVLTGSKGGVSLAVPFGLLGFGLSQVKTKTLFISSLGLAGLLALAIGGLFVKNVGWAGIGLASLYCLGILGAIARDKVASGRFVGVVVGAIALVTLLSMTTPTKGGQPSAASTPISRVGSGTQTQEQSSVFRFNLWKSAGYLIKEKPTTGYGLGSYRNESARLGIATTTVFAHNVYLQLWAEAGFIPFALFLFGTGFWIYNVFRDRKTVPTQNLYLLGGIIAAVVSILTHSLVDSDLYYFGIGLPFFLLMGLGLSLSSDSVAPELVHRPIRIFAICGASGLALVMLLFAVADDAKASARYGLRSRDSAAFAEDVNGLSWIAPFDGEASYLQALAETPPQSIETLKLAYDLMPVDRIARYLAAVQAGQGKTQEAEDILKDALSRDPNNLLTLDRLMQIQNDAGDKDGAIETAKRLVAVEATPYFKVRSIPESIPTETFDARIQILAPNAKNDQDRAKLLSEATRGYIAYADMKLRILKPNAAQNGNDPNFNVPGYDSLAEANKKLATAEAAAKEAASLYQKLGDRMHAAEMQSDSAVLATALSA